MKLLESTKIKKGENVAHVEITEADKYFPVNHSGSYQRFPAKVTYF